LLVVGTSYLKIIGRVYNRTRLFFYQSVFMKAVAYRQLSSSLSPNVLEDCDLPAPGPVVGRDILVRVKAVSVNPVDTKVRQRTTAEDGQYKILGWDAAGVVEAIGAQVTLFQPGDHVWYAGAIDRAGCNAELQLVDERIVAQMPKTLSFKQAAALPLTAITAWELLFDRLKIDGDSEGVLLVIGGAGGVGSMLIQLAKKLTRLMVIATASRPESQAWVRRLGADYCIDHRQPLANQLQALGYANVRYITSLTQTGNYLAQMVEIIAPQGAIGVIDDPVQLDIMPFKRKSVAVHWELMFTRSLFQTVDMIAQHQLLSRVAEMVDAGQLISTMNDDFGVINAANLRRAHAQLEAGTSIGKIVLGDW
jgi:NADPH:quinone reductase